MKHHIAAFFLILSLAYSGFTETSAQQRMLLSDSLVSCFLSESDPEIDSVVFIVDDGRLTVCDSIEVYFDSSMTQLAYVSEPIGRDTCCTRNFWRDGGLKKRTLYIKGEDGFEIWWWEELYCKNGQLLRQGPTGNQPGKKHYTNFYCNGKKRNEITIEGPYAVGPFTYWFENGNLENTGSFGEDGKREGLWKFWNENGKLIREERYKEDVLIDSVEH